MNDVIVLNNHIALCGGTAGATALYLWPKSLECEDGVIRYETTAAVDFAMDDSAGYIWFTEPANDLLRIVAGAGVLTFNVNTLHGINAPGDMQWHVPTQSMLIQSVGGGIYRVSFDGTTTTLEDGPVAGTLFPMDCKRWATTPTIWVNNGSTKFREIRVDDMTAKRDVTFTLVNGNSSDNQVYDPLSHAIWTGALSTSSMYKVSLDRIPPGAQTLQAVVSDMASDLLDGALDVSGLTGNVRGFVRSQPETNRQSIRRLMASHHFTGVEADGEVRFLMLGGALIATIPEADLAAHEVGAALPDQTLIERGEEISFPKRVEVSALSRARDYEVTTQGAGRQLTPATGVFKLRLSEVLTDDEAAQLADVVNHLPRVERNHHTFSLSHKYLKLIPTDEVILTKGGDTHRVRITEIDYGAPGIMKCKGVSVDAAILESSAVGEAGNFPGTSIKDTRSTTPYLMDLPLLSSTEDPNQAGFYAAGANDAATFTGYTLNRSSAKSGAGSELMLTATNEATAGYATTALADAATTTVFDESATVTVRPLNGTLSSATDDDIIYGANAIALGFEVLQFVTATDNGDGTYTLSRLLRGRRGTEWATSGHAVGDQFCLLQRDPVYNVATSITTSGVPFWYRAVTFGLALDESLPVSFTNNNRRLKPFSPVDPTASYDGTDFTFGATRRTRLFIEPEFKSVPLGEASEEYVLEIKDDAGTVLRTVTGLTSLSYTYTRAMALADYGSAPSVVYGSWYQVSEAVGRGYPLDFQTDNIIGCLSRFSDFSEYTTGGTASDWTVEQGTAAQIKDDTGTPYSYTPAGNWLYASTFGDAYWNATDCAPDVEVLVEFDHRNSASFDELLQLRAQDTNHQKHYSLRFYDDGAGSGTLDLAYRTSGGGWNTGGYTGTRTKALSSLTLPGISFYRYRIIGTRHQAKMWQGTLGSEPGWDLDATHSSITTAGDVGFVLVAGGDFPVSRLAIAYNGDTAAFL